MTVTGDGASAEEVRAAGHQGSLHDMGCIRNALRAVQPDCDHETWCDIGSGIKQVRNDGVGFALWHRWSRRSPYYPGRNATLRVWKSLAPQDPVVIFREAVSLGWASDDPWVVGMLEQAGGVEHKFSFLRYEDAPSWGDDPGASLVDGVLAPGELSVVYGEWGAGKTFFALDLAAHVAAGRHWFQRSVEPGLVAYIGGEGRVGMQRRIRGLQTKPGLSPAEVRGFLFLPSIIDLRDGTQIDELARCLRVVAGKEGMPVALVTVDTLARALNGGDENSGRDMGAAVAGAERLRVATGAHVQLLHHKGKDETKGSRGHTSLPAAVNTAIQIDLADDGRRVAKMVKQRDLPTGAELWFRLDQVNIGSSTTTVIQPAEPGVRNGKRTTKTAEEPGKHGRAAYKILERLLDDAGVKPPTDSLSNIVGPGRKVVPESEWKKRLAESLRNNTSLADVSIRKTIERVLADLVQLNIADRADGYLWIPRMAGVTPTTEDVTS